MTTTRAAKYLAPIDLGKTITATDANTGKTVTGELQSIDAIGYNIELGIIAGKDSGEYRVNYDAEVALAGQPSPHTDDPHGSDQSIGQPGYSGRFQVHRRHSAISGSDQAPRAEQLPAPIPAAQAAGHEGPIPHFTVKRDGSIEQHLQILPRRNGKTTALKAAQAADDAELGISPGPACCLGDCCGPGSYCCTHPENNHAHPIDDDENGNRP